MEKINSSNLIKHVLKIAVYCVGGFITITYALTGSVIYSIICLLGGIISITGFLLTIKIVDKVLKTGAGKRQGLFFLAALLKLILIAACFYLVSRISETAVLFYILGLSIIPLSVLIEGGYQLYRSVSNGRA